MLKESYEKIVDMLSSRDVFPCFTSLMVGITSSVVSCVIEISLTNVSTGGKVMLEECGSLLNCFVIFIILFVMVSVV